MNSSKPISTISYNSKEFLQNLLDSLVEQKIISFGCAVFHHGEQQEDGSFEKDHFHVFMEPNKKVNTVDLQELSQEVDPNLPEGKPLKCIDFQSSKWEDWVWYGIHDDLYLQSKGEVRQFVYSEKDFIYTDEEEFDWRFHRALNSGQIFRKLKIHRKIASGATINDLARIGYIDETNAGGFIAWDKLVHDQVAEANDRLTMECSAKAEEITLLKKQIADMKRHLHLEGEKERMRQLDAPIKKDGQE